MKKSVVYPLLNKPLVAGLSTFVLLLLITQYLAYQKYLIYEKEKQEEINTQIILIKEKLQSIVQYSYSATKTLQYVVERYGIPKDFDSIAYGLLKGQKYFDVVQLVDGNGFITHVYPLKGNEVLGFNILKSSTSISGAQETIDRKEFFIAGPVKLKQGGLGMISRQPIFIDGKFSGFSAVITQLSNFINDLNIDASNDNRFTYQLSKINMETGEEEFFLEKDMTAFKQYAIPIKMPYGEWKLYVIPNKKPKLISAFWVSTFGILMSVLGGIVVWFLIGRPMRLNKIINEKLIEQETELKLIHETAKQQIEKSELLYRSLTSNAPVLIFNTNEAGEWTYVNIEWKNYTGRNFEEAMGYGWKNALHPEDKERVLIEWQTAVLTNSDFKSEFRFKSLEGKITHLSTKAIKLIDVNNKMLGYIGMSSDITERINQEKELLIYKNNLEKLVDIRTEELNKSRKALINLLEDLNAQSTELEKEKKKAQSADLMKSAFLATMSHELRTPMNSIIGFTGILLKELAGPINEEQKKQLSMVKASGEHLLRLINDVLDISKIEAGKLTLSFTSFDFIKTVEKTVHFLSPQASKKELSIISEFSVSSITLYSDERRVEQVLINLISNAIKFSKQRRITINVSITDTMLVTEIIDQGIGISKEDIGKLFTPFTQLASGLSRGHEGTGLGLAISKSLIEKLEGTIHVQSEKGKGSIFTFKLPFKHSGNK